MGAQKMYAMVLAVPLVFLAVVSVFYWKRFGSDERKETSKQDIAYNKLSLTLVGMGYFGIWIVWISGIILLFMGKLHPGTVPSDMHLIHQVVPFFGTVLLYAGSLFFGWTLYSSGKYLRPSIAGVHTDHKLIQTGPLGIVRHPYYTSYLVLLSGLGLALRTWWAVPFLAFLLLGIGPSAEAEENELADRFGDDYATYQRKTGRFFPKRGERPRIGIPGDD